MIVFTKNISLSIGESIDQLHRFLSLLHTHENVLCLCPRPLEFKNLKLSSSTRLRCSVRFIGIVSILSPSATTIGHSHNNRHSVPPYRSLHAVRCIQPNPIGPPIWSLIYGHRLNCDRPGAPTSKLDITCLDSYSVH